MTKLIDIESIGPVYAEKLRQYGVRSNNDLLKKAATPEGRKEMSEATGIEVKVILEWVNMADLMRIDGMGPEYASLLRAAGVDVTPELALRDPKQLHKTLVEINDRERLVLRVPSEEVLYRWIKQARQTRRTVEY